jgi:nitrogenase molybdenum-iron protein alpha/beta subunit
MSTTAMSEVDTILGGEENVEAAILTLVEKAQPELIGLLTTGLTETRGDDMPRILRELRRRQPQLQDLPIVLASTPDFKGSLQDGYAIAVHSLVSTLPEPPSGSVHPAQVTVLCGPALTPADAQEIKEMVEAFGLEPILVPDLSGSLDGHLGTGFRATPDGGTSLEQLRQLGRSGLTIAVGESIAPCRSDPGPALWHPLSGFPPPDRSQGCGSLFGDLGRSQPAAGAPLATAASAARFKMPSWIATFSSATSGLPWP